MCRNFDAKAIYILEEDAYSTDHQGNPYVNKDYPKGSILCSGADGEWYARRRSGHEDIDRLPSSWPSELFRDHWKILERDITNQDSKTSTPYFRAIGNARRTCIVEFPG